MNRIQRALISVFDKRGVADFARALADMGVEILSTGGTARLLREAGIAVTEVSEVTGFPEILDGRVKTLHPRIHAGLLAVRGNPDHQRQLGEQDIRPIDLVAVNLYPFAETTRKEGVTFEEVIENIDIGGPSILRAAAKNFEDVAVVTHPDDYASIVEELQQEGGVLSTARLFSLAQDAFVHTAQYDGAIGQYLSGVRSNGSGFVLPNGSSFPQRLFMNFERVAQLRYGENPHQEGAFYRWGSGGAAWTGEGSPAPGKKAFL